jgi:hypothetical protein
MICSVEKTLDSNNSPSIPRSGIGKCAHTHLIKPESVGPMFTHYVVWIDDVSTRFTHFLSIWTKDESNIGEFLEWFFRRNNTKFIENFVPKSSIQEMEYSMLCSSDVFIHHTPVFESLSTGKGGWIFWIHVAQIVPTTSSPLGHSISFPFSSEVISKSNIHPLRNGRKWRLSIPCWFIFLHFWECEGEMWIEDYLCIESIKNLRIFTPINEKILFVISRNNTRSRWCKSSWKGLILLLIDMNDRNRFTPVSLTREKPITEFVIDFLFPKSFFFCFFCENTTSIRRSKSVVLT